MVGHMEEPVGNAVTEPKGEIFLREHRASCAKCLRKVPLRCRQKRSLDCAVWRKWLIYLGGFRGKQGQKPDCQGEKGGGCLDGDRDWRRLLPEAELRRGERGKKWQGCRI